MGSPGPKLTQHRLGPALEHPQLPYRPAEQGYCVLASVAGWDQPTGFATPMGLLLPSAPNGLCGLDAQDQEHQDLGSAAAGTWQVNFHHLYHRLPDYSFSLHLWKSWGHSQAMNLFHIPSGEQQHSQASQPFSKLTTAHLENQQVFSA